MSAPLRVAFVGGPMYDHLYDGFAPGAVEVVVQADHPTLNARVAEMLAAGERIDVLATHSKYAPSQQQWLRPLDGLVAPEVLAALAPRAVDLCRFAGTLLSVPRLIDVRVLWARADRVEAVPDSWDALLDSEVVFGFPGRESGLFGTFFELVVGAGGSLFDADLAPTMATPEAEAAVDTLCRLAARVPGGLTGWHYDAVDTALLDGTVDAAGVWPGGWGPIRDSALAPVLRPFPYPTGPVRRVSYSGCHSWAIPTTCADVPGAVALVETLAGREAQALDASGGSLCAHVDALGGLVSAGPVDAERLRITRATIAEAMITYPPLAAFPAVEDAGWSAIRAALLGECSPRRATERIQSAAESALA